MDPRLQSAIEAVHQPTDWVHVATIGRDGGPHVTPMMMGLEPPYLLFSFTGKQKVRNLERDPRACVSIAKPDSMAHVIVWGTLEMRWDGEAQLLWERMIRTAFGEQGLVQRARTLGPEATRLGLLTPRHHRIYGIT